MLGAAKPLRRPGEEHLAVREDEELTRVALGLGDVVGRKGDARPTGDARQDELPKARALARVERRARLVEQQHGGIRDQADRDVDALAVAAREPADGLVCALAQASLVEHSGDGRLDVRDALEPREQAQVLRDREL